MKLYQSPTSPYVQIVLACALEKGLRDQIELVAAREPGNDLETLNPLNKIPTLVTDDGETLIESKLICQYLDSLGTARLYPADPAARRAVLQKEAVVQGMLDAVVLRRMESRREDSEQSAWWIERQNRKIDLGLTKIENELDDFTGDDTIIPIELCCGLSFMDKLTQEVSGDTWRNKYPKLAAWAKSFADTPTMREILPPK